MSANSRIQTQFQVTIEKMAIGGAGVARHDGLVIFVQDAAPGDELLIEITKDKKTFAEAKIVTILKPGPNRKNPVCPIATKCGGCNWQHLTEEEQRNQKQQFVKETLERFLKNIPFEYLPIKPSPKTFRYRNRIQPKIHAGKFGFYERDSHTVVETEDCLITEEILASAMPEVKAWAQAQRYDGRLEMYLDTQQKVRYNTIDDQDEAVGFSQVNRFQNPELVQTVLDWSKDHQYEHVYDLYAGSGNFSFPLAETHRAHLTAVELNPKLVELARSKKKSDVQFIQSGVERWVRRAKFTSQDLVVLDPPRSGCAEDVMKTLAQYPPKKIIYISCHPVSLARDLKWLFDWSKKFQKADFRLRRVQTFEMFPQTDHVETIAELEVDS